MADKSKMKCNVVVRSDRPGKKKMVKACENGREKSLFTLEQKDMDIIIQLLQGKALEQDINVEQQNQN